MSVLGLSIVVMALVAAAALISALIAESAAAGTQPARRFDGAGMAPAAPADSLRCRPQILPKCPRGERRVCLQMKGACCTKFGCQPSRSR